MSIRKRGQRSFQVRVPGFPAQTAPTREAAERIELDLKRRKALGALYDAPAMTLGEVIDGTLARIAATGAVTEKTRAHNEASAKFWAPLRDVKLASLRRERVEEMMLERAKQHPRSAKNELELLKRVLREASERGQRVDEDLFAIPPVRHRAASGRALTASELHELASWFPEHCARLVLLAGQIGCRQSVWFNVTDEMLDLHARTLTIPAALAKGRREHRIYLTELEVKLLREQLLVRPAGTRLLFPTPEGKRWTANRFRDRVWLRALEAAVENDGSRLDDGSSIFEGLTFHMLRHTAASLMALAGMDASVAAERLEHSDGGAQFQRAYRHLAGGERREEARRLETLVLAEVDEKRTSEYDASRTPVARAISDGKRYWAKSACVLRRTVGLSRGSFQLLKGEGKMRRKLDWRLSGAVMVCLVIGAFVFGVALSGSSPSAAPVAWLGASASSNALSTGPHGLLNHLTSVQPVHSKPQQLFLTRAHGAVFNVKKLKSVVVRRFRPEAADPLHFGGDSDAASATAFPAHLAQSQMVKKEAAASTSATSMPSIDSSFDGLDFNTWGAGHPPDENGDVGPNYYIQTVNTSIGIYNKSNGNQVAAFTFNSFMSQGHFGNLCDTANFGDPVVLYDSYENRWFITDFAFTLDGSGNVQNPVYQCFAVSKTGDPVNGGWNYYSITDPTGSYGDYPKFGIWPDGIYMSANLFGVGASSTYQAFHEWALNKQQMYAGAPQVSVVDFSGSSSDFTVIPVNSKLAAGAPPAGSPEYFVSTELYLNALAVYKFQVNWDKVSTSTFTGPFTSLAPNCWPNATPANASTPANAADVLAIRAMFSPQYQNLNGVESLWVAHTVQRGVSATNTTCNATTGGNATVRWYQDNVTGGTIAANLTQGSSFDPDGANTNFRYQPALAVDDQGDVGMTYTESNSTTNPKVMYNGRLAGDAANTLGTESTLIAGTGAQSGNCGSSACVRWGDYAGMQLDPDGCEFWMDGEYFATTGLDDLTRIGSFHFPGCTTIGNGTLSGTVTDGTNPISGATLTLGSRTTTTDSNGNYSFTVPAGTYLSLTADQPGYTEGSASSLVVPSGGTLTRNFTLSTASTSGCIQDNSQSLFQRGVPTNCDLTGNPGNIQLASPNNTAAENLTVTPSGFGITNTSWAGQTFTPTVSGKLNEVDIFLFCASCTATSPNITVSIRATTGTTPVPTGSDLATATIAGFNDGGAGGLHQAIFSTPLQVTAGTRYAIVFRNVAVFSSGTMAYTCSCATTGYSNSNPYTSGQRVTSTTSGSTWTADTTSGGRDLEFITYINPGFASAGTFVSSLKDANPAAGSTAHWNTLSFTDTTPANTNVQFQVAGSNSQYGPWNYVGPDGTASTYFTTSGADLSEFNGDRYIKYEAFLTSSNTGATPVLSSVTTCFTDVGSAAATSLAPASATGTYGGTTTLTATLTSGGNGVQGETVNFSLNGSSVGGATTDANGVATLNSVSLAGINAGSYPSGVTASFAGDSNYLLSGSTNSLTVSKADQAIVISQHAPSTAAVDDQFTVAATGGGSGNAVAYGSSGACTNSGAMYTITGTGTCTVTYDQAGSSNYNAAPELSDSVNSSKANQTIHVTTAAPSSAVYGTGFTVAATGGKSNNPVTFGSSGGCTNNGADFTMTSGSTDCTVTFDQAGNSNYNDATEVTETVTAQKADQTIDVTMDAPASAAYNSSFDVAASASSSPIAFASSGACSNVGAHFTMTSGTGTCTVLFDQGGDDNYNAAPEVSESVAATKIDQSITFLNPGDHTFGDSDFDPGATSSSGYAVSYGASGACSIVSGLVHLTGAGSCTVTADQAGDSDYNAAPQVQQTFTVNKAEQSIEIGTDAPSSAVYGTGFTVSATGGGSGNPVTYGSLGGCTNTGADFTMTSGSTDCTVTYDEAGDSNYNAATQLTEVVTAEKADQTILITQHAPSTAQVNDQFTVSATGGGSSSDVVYGSSGGCTNTGADFTVTGTGTCVVTYDQAGDSNYNAAPELTDFVNSSKADQTIDVTTAAPSSAVYGTDFTVAATGGGSGNDVTYGSAGSCTNTGADFTMTSGTGTCTVTYDQAGNSNYNPASEVTESVTAEKANQSITFATPPSHTYGNPDFAPGATASSGNAVSYGASGACSIVSGKVHLTGAGSCTVNADQAGDGNYNAATQVSRMFSVGKAALSITASGRSKYFDQAISLGTTAFTTSGLVGTDSISGVTLTSSGVAASAPSGSYQIVAAGAVAGASTSLGNYTITYHTGTLQVVAVGLIGLSGVSVATTGGTIDSFDSSLGVYGPSNHGSTAFVLSNGTLSFSGVSLLGNTISTMGSVSVAHTASVSGFVAAGTTVSNSGTISGSVTQHSPSTSLSVPTVSACSPFSAKKGISGGTFTYSSGNLTVKKGTVKLANGTYCFHNVTVAAGAKLSVSGAVTINLTGKLAAKGQIVNTTNLPAKLTIRSSVSVSGGVALVGNAGAAMTITAPKTSVTITGGAYAGTVLAGSVSLTGNVAFHADQH